MKTICVVNPNAANGKAGKEWHEHHRALDGALGPSEVQMTAGPGDATMLVRRAIDDGYERVVVVGGDGTVNEAVNGLFSADGTRIGEDLRLVYYPVGTGGDFARSVGLSGGGVAERLKQASERRIDLGKVVLRAPDGSETTRWFANIASFGSSGLIVDKVNRSSKAFGGKASFLFGTVRGLVAYRNQRIRLRVDDTFDEEMLINTVAVANGRYFGGSMKIAPTARLDDGSFEIVIIGDIGLSTFVRYSRSLYRGDHISKPGVRVLHGRTVTATPLGEESVFVETDGEQPGALPARFEVLPQALWMVAPWQDAEGVD